MNEALDNPTSLDILLGEADDAIRVLKRTLLREDQQKHAQCALLGVFDNDFVSIAQNIPRAQADKLREALEIKMRAVMLFEDRAQLQR